MNTKKNRNRDWDVVKGLGIFLVVLGHSGFSIVSILYVINYFHLAIFFFAAGAFYNDAYSRNPIIYIGKKLKDIWWPTIKYVVFFLLCHNIFLSLNIYSTVTGQPSITPMAVFTMTEIRRSIVSYVLTTNGSPQLAGAMWFIFPLIVAMALYCAIRCLGSFLKINEGKKYEVFTATCAIALSSTGLYFLAIKYYLPWKVELSLVIMPILYTGHLIKRNWNTFPLKSYWGVLAIFLLCLSFYSGLEISYVSGLVTNDMLFFPATFAGIYLLLYSANLIKNFEKPAKVFALMGENSFHIMALHFLAFKAVNLIDVLINKKEMFYIAQFPSSNWNYWFGYLCAGLILPIICVKLYDQILVSISDLVSHWKISFLPQNIFTIKLPVRKSLAIVSPSNTLPDGYCEAKRSSD